MAEQRITDELKSYWERLRGNRPFPSEDQISADELTLIWQNCFLAKFEGGHFSYDFLGESIIEAYADNTVGEDIIEDQLYPESPGIINKFQEVVTYKMPVYYEGSFINKDNLDIKFRKILLPLGIDGNVQYILGAMRWKSSGIFSM